MENLIPIAILEIPLPAVRGVIETLSSLPPEELDPIEKDLLEAMIEIEPLIVEYNNAKRN